MSQKPKVPRTPRETAIAYAECLRTGDFEGLVALHHPEMICALLGKTLVSGRYRGRDAFFAHTFEHVLGSLAETDEIYLKDYRIGCADERHAVMLLHGGLPTKTGGRYDQNYLQIFRVADGLIVETHELLDTMMLDSQVLARPPARAWAPPPEPLRPALRGAGQAPFLDAATADEFAGQWMASLNGGDWPALSRGLADDAVLQIAGVAPGSGTVEGRDAIRERLERHAVQHFDATGLHVEGVPRLVCLSDEGFCILVNVAGRLRDGRDYAQTIGMVATARGDRIGEVQLYFDTAAEEAQVHDNPPLGPVRAGSAEPFTITSEYDAHDPTV